MTIPTLPLSDIVDVTVQVSPQAVQPPQFNQALIIDNGTVIPNAQRLRLYTGGTAILPQMLADGFTSTSAAYLAASAYVGAGVGTPTPYFLWIGLQDISAIQTAIETSGHAGAGYAVGDKFSITQGSASGGIGIVDSVTGGAVATWHLFQQGTGYSVASGLATTALTGSGTGLEVDITAIGETPLQAAIACRLASSAWYLFTALQAVDADNIALAEWAQTASPQVQLFFQTASASALNGTTGNIFSTLKTGNYNRYQGAYATVQGENTTSDTVLGNFFLHVASATGISVGQTIIGAGIPSGATVQFISGTTITMSAAATANASGVSISFQTAPNNTYLMCALMGMAMGLNTGLPGSYFVLPFKPLTGMTPEPLTQSQVNTINGNNGNVYSSYASTYDSYGPGITGNGQYFDQVLGLDMLAANLQFGEANTLFDYTAIPQNNAGQAILLHAANVACQISVDIGFLAPAVWNGPTILALKAGDSVKAGYLCQSALYSTQAPSDRALRKSMPILVAATLAGAVQSILIAVFVQQ